ncbi:BamA/TamA family outer membrane protein [bacterium]|nr:BamA/TamA family outer membrane protein [bacterium]
MLLLTVVPGSAQTIQDAPEIVDIKISGNVNISTSDLLDQTHLKEKRLFSQGSFYNQHHVVREVETLVNFYTLNGFLDVVITDSVSISDKNEARLFFNVLEGNQYYLRKIVLSGNSVFSDIQYMGLIEYRAGSSFNTFQIRENLIEMLALYRDNGYPLISIQDSVVVDDSVSLYINVIEGPQLNIGEINITEPEQIPERTIRREIIIKPGELFSLSKIEESKRRLYETSLFNSVNIRSSAVDLEAKTINLDVEVIPAKFKGFDMNLGVKQGYSDEAINADPVLSFGLSGSWYHINLFEQSRRIRAETKVSSIYPAVFIPQNFKFDFFYVEPWLQKFRIPLTINPFYWYIDNQRTSFKNVASGIRAILTYRWFRKVKIQSLAEWSVSKSSGTPTDTEEEYEEAHKVGLKIIWDERDNFFSPHNGFKMVIEPQVVGYALGGENNYMQIQSSFSSYWNVFANVVFAHNINVAFAVQKDPDIVIPYEKRFFLGGNSSIRGYEQQALGPKLPGDELVPVGGNFRFYTNFEVRFPIYGFLGGELFYDVGNLWPEFGEASLSDLKSAIGAGVTFETPIGPARIDYGIPIRPDSDIKNSQTHIAIAYAF